MTKRVTIPSRYLAVKPGQMPIHFRELTISEMDELITQEFLIYELKDIKEETIADR